MTHALLPVQIEENWVALEALHVREVVSHLEWIPLPGSSAESPGVACWRGRAIAVVDLGFLSSLGPSLSPGSTRRRTIIAEAEGATIAIPVDGVREVLEFAEIPPAQATQVPHSAGEVEIAGRPTPVLDLPGIMRSLLAQRSET